MFTENPERIIKERQIFENYTVLTLNNSHVVPLEDLYETIGKINDQTENGNKISFVAETIDEFINQETSNSNWLRLSWYSFLITPLLVAFFSH